MLPPLGRRSTREPRHNANDTQHRERRFTAHCEGESDDRETVITTWQPAVIHGQYPFV